MLVETGNFITRNNAQYQVIIADENIFIICECRYDEKEESFVTNYEKPEVYSNCTLVNSLKDLNMKVNCNINEYVEDCESCGFAVKNKKKRGFIMFNKIKKYYVCTIAKEKF